MYAWRGGWYLSPFLSPFPSCIHLCFFSLLWNKLNIWPRENWCSIIGKIHVSEHTVLATCSKQQDETSNTGWMLSWSPVTFYPEQMKQLNFAQVVPQKHIYACVSKISLPPHSKSKRKGSMPMQFPLCHTGLLPLAKNSVMDAWPEASTSWEHPLFYHLFGCVFPPLKTYFKLVISWLKQSLWVSSIWFRLKVKLSELGSSSRESRKRRRRRISVWFSLSPLPCCICQLSISVIIFQEIKTTQPLSRFVPSFLKT